MLDFWRKLAEEMINYGRPVHPDDDSPPNKWHRARYSVDGYVCLHRIPRYSVDGYVRPHRIPRYSVDGYVRPHRFT